jgi:peptidoglycan-N-acetylglucosamine deacetylase
MKKILLLLIVLSVSFAGYSRLLKKHIPDKLVVLTFDDATASHYSFVAPLLKKYGFGATFFVCEFGQNFKDTSKYMNWRQIQELDKMGFEVANHTRTHPSVSRLTKEQFIDELKYIENKCDSLNIGRPSAFAYPAYDMSQPVVDVLSERGYQFARVGGGRAYDPLSDHPLLVPSWAMTASNKPQIMKAFQEARNGKIVVLTIHGVPDVEHPWVNTTPELFKEYLQYLYDRHFKVIPFRELGRYIDVKKARESILPDLNKKLKS